MFTDPDLEFNDPLPDDFVSRMLELSSKYRIGKVGCALKIEEELFDTFDLNGIVVDVPKTESRYWKNQIEPDVYVALIDTTMALVNKKYYRKNKPKRALRVGGAWQAAHLPWYRDKKMAPSELAAYTKEKQKTVWFREEMEKYLKKPWLLKNIDGGAETVKDWLKK